MKFRDRALCCVLFVLPALLAFPAGAAPVPELPNRLDTMFREAYPADQPGAAVLVQLGDETVLRQAYGMADVELGVPLQPEMIFRLGSVTKQFTAVAVLMLAAEGKVDLDARVDAYLTDFPEPGAAATVAQLLTHTSGIHSYTDDPDFWQTMAVDKSLDDLIATWRDTPLDFQPGDDWRYSNSGYVMLGKVIEAASGQQYAAFLQERIFTPLGLAHTMYGDPQTITPGRVRGYDGGPDGLQNAAYISMTLPHAAGSLLSNVDDLLVWGRAMLQGDTLLDAAWRERLLQPAVLNDGRRTNYACGLAVLEYAGHQVITHNGGINGFSTSVYYVPDVDLTVAVLSNTTAGADPGQLAQNAVTLALGVPLDERPGVDVAADRLEPILGVYRLHGDPQQTRVLRHEDGAVTSQRGGGRPRTIRFSAPDAFYFAESLTHGRVLRDGDGNVTGLAVVPQIGAEEIWDRTDEDPPAEREAIELADLGLLDKLTGRYELMPGFVLEVRRQGDELWTQATGQQALRILPESESRWFLTEVDAVLEFSGWEDGQADALMLFQAGREMPAKRVD